MKKILSFILAVLLASGVLTVAVFAACEHEFLALRNGASHYEECQKCFELRNAGSHTYVDGKCTACGFEEPISPFVDVANDAWYAEDVLIAVATELINGKGNGFFKPSDNLTYAEAVKLAACMNEKYVKGEVTLEIGNPWYQTYVDYCKENYIISTDYNWSDFATRIGYMYIFAYALPEEAYEEINVIEDGTIPDVPMDAPYAQIVYKLYRAGIVTGVDARHNCNPTANITRAEVAVIVARMMDPSKRIRFEMKHVYDSTLDDGSDVEIGGNSSVVVGGGDNVDYEVDKGDLTLDNTKLPLSIIADPAPYEAKAYGEKAELKVETDGGKPQLTYEWYYYAYRNEKVKIENGEYVSGADTATLTVSVEKNNGLLGSKVFCKVNDANGAEVSSETAYVYGPFSMNIENVEKAEDMYVMLVGRVEDGIVRTGDRIEIKHGDETLCDGYVQKIEMFGKELDEASKGDNIGILFDSTYGHLVIDFVEAGDIAVLFVPSPVTPEDIVN